MSEQSISSARASVMVYDDGQKRWVPSGTSCGLSKVHIYHHTQHNTFRVVGRKLNDHEGYTQGSLSTSINSSIASSTNHSAVFMAKHASVMVYDDGQKRWVPSGTSCGLSKVHIYHHTQHNTFCVVGRKLNDHEVVINCGIVRGLKYNQATATFHQWRDARHVYGLNFSCREDADSFARAMMHTLEVLANKQPGTPAPPPAPAPYNGHNNQHTTYDEDMGYRTMTREDAAILQQPQYHAPQHQPQPQYHAPSQYHAPHTHHQVQQPTPPPAPTPPAPPPHGLHNTLPHQPPASGHHRTSSAPMPPNMSLAPPAPPRRPPCRRTRTCRLPTT
ncbi:unnamed protein product [Plutella xylostella]|uniref:(diamondback moth) hypothetical protein n=1 Tax=Plutella xylostella TaxID=51655 RepID=A0A8S4EMR4_PLUXY|nr:unnamed protein product [Plutella xylostella]